SSNHRASWSSAMGRLVARWTESTATERLSSLARLCRVRNTALVLLLLVFGASSAGATDIVVAGLFTDKALVQIDGGALQMLSVGDSAPGSIKLLSVTHDSATFEMAAKHVTIGVGLGRTR